MLTEIYTKVCSVNFHMSYFHMFCLLAKIRDGETTTKIKFSLLRGGGPWGQERKIAPNACFRGKRHDNKILKVQILLSRNFVVIQWNPSVEPKVRLQGYGYSPLCSHSFSCLETLG